MFQIMTQIEFCYGHRLQGHEGPCRHLHGHNGRVELDLAVDTLDGRDMVYEFGEVKDIIKGWIDATLDHRVLLRRDDPLVPALQEAGEPLYLLDRNPTAEVIAEEIYRYAADKGLPVIEVRLWETQNSYAAYSCDPQKESRS